MATRATATRDALIELVCRKCGRYFATFLVDDDGIHGPLPQASINPKGNPRRLRMFDTSEDPSEVGKKWDADCPCGAHPQLTRKYLEPVLQRARRLGVIRLPVA